MINNIVLMGRLTADPELKHTNSDVAVTSFTLAVERDYRQGDERISDFINCVAWRGTAEFVSKYFAKGQMMALTGTLQSRQYEDKQGSRRTAWEVVANNVSFCGGKVESGEKKNIDAVNDDFIGDDDFMPF